LSAESAANKTDDFLDRLAWGWLLSNFEAYAKISQLGGTVLRYQDLASSLKPEMCSLFSKLGLDWSDSTMQFLKTSSAGGGSYYCVARDPATAANEWNSQMDKQQIEKVRRIACLDPIGQQ
jgi:hypothetical protein